MDVLDTHTHAHTPNQPSSLALQHGAEPGADQPSVHEAGFDGVGPQAAWGQHVRTRPRETGPDQGLSDPQQLPAPGQVRNEHHSHRLHTHLLSLPPHCRPQEDIFRARRRWAPRVLSSGLLLYILSYNNMFEWSCSCGSIVFLYIL